MTKSAIPVHVCDRCKTRQELRNSHEEYNWAEFWAAQANGPIWFGSQKRCDKTLDLCPRCIDELRDWFKAPSVPRQGRGSNG